jgi:hypothetical protein
VIRGLQVHASIARDTADGLFTGALPRAKERAHLGVVGISRDEQVQLWHP